MKIKVIYRRLAMYPLLMAMVLNLGSCSLDEVNPGGYTMEILGATESGFQGLVNQCYFGMQRRYYGASGAANSASNLGWGQMMEGSTDLWTNERNLENNTQWYWFYAGAAPNITYTIEWWNPAYDGIGSCNLVLSLAEAGVPPQKGSELNNLLAQAHFLRAVYYHNLVHLFGGATLTTTPPTGNIEFEPQRSDPMTIYEQVIIPDLEFALEHLYKGDDNVSTIPTKKSALGFLVKALLQTREFDKSGQYTADALKYAKMLIDDCESGGAQYGAFMYPTFAEVFNPANNWGNKEALWKHRWYVGAAGSGSSNGNHVTNSKTDQFYCKYDDFGARQNITGTTDRPGNSPGRRYTMDGNPPGTFMPSQYLLSLFMKDNGGALDPRFHASFQTEWVANINYTWDAGAMERFDRTGVLGETLVDLNDLAIRFVMPLDDNYQTETANKHTSKYLLVDYADVYNDAGKNVKMTYNHVHYPATGIVNPFKSFYPSLSKFNSDDWYCVSEANNRWGNRLGVLIMRMAEIYLLAAEAEVYLNGDNAPNALTYINKVRTRAGAIPLTSVNIRTILDERARELCGEDTRFYDLKRTGMFSAAYLQETHPDLAKYFKPEYALRPIPQAFLNVLKGGGAYYQNPGY